jgi:hypothetical protein
MFPGRSCVQNRVSGRASTYENVANCRATSDGLHPNDARTDATGCRRRVSAIRSVIGDAATESEGIQ